MQAGDVMTRRVMVVSPETTVEDVARRMLERGVSGLPVVDGDGTLVGIVSEGDLVRRSSAGMRHTGAWWLEALTAPVEAAEHYLTRRQRTARDVMSSPVWTVDEHASLGEIAELLERRRIKRVPVLRRGEMIGIVSRADLLHGLATQQARKRVRARDRRLRQTIAERLRVDAGVDDETLNVTVAEGTAHLWGSVRSQRDLDAAELYAAGVPGVRSVRNHARVTPRMQPLGA